MALCLHLLRSCFKLIGTHPRNLPTYEEGGDRVSRTRFGAGAKFVLKQVLSIIFTICAFMVPVSGATPDSTAVQPGVSVPVNAAPVDLSTTLAITDPSQPPAHWVTPFGDSTCVLESFDYPRFLNTYPDKIWEGRSGWRYSKTRKSEVYYRILIEGDNYYLSAETQGGAVNFGRATQLLYRGKKIKANLRLFQKLRWRWRVHRLPEGSDETDSGKNDSAAAVRLLFGTGVFSGKSLKYIWSATLPVGTVIESSRQYVVVLRSGADELGKWVWEEVNAYKDYRRLFGGDPRPADALGLLTDSNNTGTVVGADYDDIIFLIPRPTVETIPENPE